VIVPNHESSGADVDMDWDDDDDLIVEEMD
jgi:hypothetical protein